MMTYLVREHTDFLKYGADGSTPLLASGEGNDAVTAHVVTATHDGTAHTTETHAVRNVQLQAESCSQHQQPTRRRCDPAELGEQA